MKGLHMITFLLLILGGLNWLLVGLFNWDIGMLFGGMGALVSRIIYILIGISAIVELFSHKKCCGTCGTKGNHNAPSAGGEHPEGGM